MIAGWRRGGLPEVEAKLEHGKMKSCAMEWFGTACNLGVRMQHAMQYVGGRIEVVLQSQVQRW